MKRKILNRFIAIIMILSTLILSSCELFNRPVDSPTGSNPPPTGDDPNTEHQHEWNVWIYEVDPTCSEEGKRGRKCYCGDLEYEAIPATGDHYSNTWIIDKQVTCQTDGEKHKICDYCGAEFARKTVLAAHVFEDDACVTCGKSVDDLFTFTHNDYDNFYTFKGLTATAKLYETSIILPTTYKGEPVKVVSARALSGNYYLKSITVPEGYTKICEEAFSKCSALVTAELPESVTEMQRGIFTGCEKLTSVNIPRVITKIPDSCFTSCDSLTDTTSIIHSNITEIGEYAFDYCQGFTRIVIPDTVKILRAYAFSGCNNVTEIVVGRRVKRIETHALAGDIPLKSIIMRDSHGWVLKAYLIATGEPIDVPISREDLENTFRAALYFKQTYVSYNWEKK